ncbi:hypothetical protein E2562_019989 [Oryza meyeriana var. granulata]|uniref:MBD domain-containing protein n=1 Tax=Oryza meyeriana var. granulata TaxID=110450 RepID=A0A6G1CH95_9ORYZ|nr:hypothetical protein E2562_019989 [Oryza meyeriana var. granulata]
MVQVKNERAMNGLSDDCLKEDSPGKNEPNHKSNLVENKDKPIMKGPNGWWKEGMPIKNGSKNRSDPIQIKDEVSINGLSDGRWKENKARKNGSDHKNELVQRKDELGLPDGWWKEDRPRKNGSNQKTDPYYIDPVSGYEFRSLKDVHRFLQSGDIYQCNNNVVATYKASQNVPATAPAQPTRVELSGAVADPSGLAVPSLFGNSWSDPCIEFAFKTLTGDIPVLDDTSAVEEYFPQHDLNKPPSPDYSASPSCFTSSFDNSRNFTQVDHVSLPAPNPSDKLYNGGWFPPK